MLKTVARFNKGLQDAVEQFKTKVNELGNKVFDEKCSKLSKNSRLTRDNDYLNLFDVFIPINTLADTIRTEMIGHGLDSAVIPEYDPETRHLYLKVSDPIIIGIIEILTEWEHRIETDHSKDHFQHYNCNYDETGREKSRYYAGCLSNSIMIKL